VAVALAILAMRLAAAESPAAAPPVPGFGLWVWGHSHCVDPQARAGLLAFCEGHRFSDVAVTVPPLADDPAVEPALRAFLAGAAARHLRVSPLRGDPHPAYPAVRAQELAQVKALLDLNAALP